jgi:mono/diheme cytochrome c family protein
MKGFALLILSFCLLPSVFLSVACRQDMHDQPKYRPLQPSVFFPDGRSARPTVEGTVARGQLRDDAQLHTGKLGQQGGRSAAEPMATSRPDNTANQQATSDQQAGSDQQATSGINTQTGQQAATPNYQGFSTTFPFPIDEAAINRGQQRFNIYCSVCHGRTGEGGGTVVLRGYRRPPSLHEPRLQNAPAGYYFDVITNGFGAMPDYSAQVAVEDRWKIIAYIRALQLSQRANIQDVPADQKDKIRTPNSQQGGEQGDHKQ